MPAEIPDILLPQAPGLGLDSEGADISVPGSSFLLIQYFRAYAGTVRCGFPDQRIRIRKHFPGEIAKPFRCVDGSTVEYGPFIETVRGFQSPSGPADKAVTGDTHHEEDEPALLYVLGAHLRRVARVLDRRGQHPQAVRVPDLHERPGRVRPDDLSRVVQGFEECGDCGCEYDALYRRFLALQKAL